MLLVVNGEKRSFEPPPATVEDLVGALGLPTARVAVEVNGRVIKRADRPTHPLAEGDLVEVVTLVGGG